MEVDTVEEDGQAHEDLSSISSSVTDEVKREKELCKKHSQTQVGMREAQATDKELDKHAEDGLVTPYFSFSSASSASSGSEVMVCP